MDSDTESWFNYDDNEDYEKYTDIYDQYKQKEKENEKNMLLIKKLEDKCAKLEETNMFLTQENAELIINQTNILAQYKHTNKRNIFDQPILKYTHNGEITNIRIIHYGVYYKVIYHVETMSKKLIYNEPQKILQYFTKPETINTASSLLQYLLHINSEVCLFGRNDQHICRMLLHKLQCITTKNPFTLRSEIGHNLDEIEIIKCYKFLFDISGESNNKMIEWLGDSIPTQTKNIIEKLNPVDDIDQTLVDYLFTL